MEKLYFRENYLKQIRGFYHDTAMIKVVTGIRRCGKSSLLEMVISELIDSGTDKENIIYIHLDKRPYRKVKTDIQLEEIIDEKTSNIKGTKYLFIDEIQNVKDFEEVINAFREEGDYSIFITGSNSYLLSGELVTKLTGRYIEFEMQPLSFDEYLGMKEFLGKEINPNTDYELDEYVVNGGFPQSLKYDDKDMKRKYTESVIAEIFEKDIKKNRKVKRKDIFEKIQTYIINNFGSTTSVSSLCEYLDKIGSSIHPNTAYNYLNILEEAKIISKCKRFDMKSKSSLNGEEKYYLTDMSFYFCRNVDNRINYGPALENIMYNYFKSCGYKVGIGKIGKFECDFIIRNSGADYAYVQVAKTIDNDNYDENGLNKTEEREYRPLESVKDGYPKYLLTLDHLLQKRNGINHLNIVNLLKDQQELI